MLVSAPPHYTIGASYHPTLLYRGLCGWKESVPSHLWPGDTGHEVFETSTYPGEPWNVWGFWGLVGKVGITPLECARLDLGLGGLSISKPLALCPTHASLAGQDPHHAHSVGPQQVANRRSPAQ